MELLFIRRVFLSSAVIRALTLIRPPRNPSLYSLKSAKPPVGKSGKILTFLPFRMLIEPSINSMKLWGNILHAKPTAIPSTPEASNNGNFTGSVIGSRFRPSSTQLPIGCFWIEYNLQSKFGQTSFDVSRSSRTITGQNIPPVSLTIDH